MRWAWGIGVAAVLAGTPAGAAWQQATSQHFVVYSDDSPERVRQQAEELETFDAVLRKFQKLTPSPDAGFNKVTVYVTGGEGAVQRLCRCKNVVGFYVPRATGSIAFTIRRGSDTGAGALTPRIVLFHEYAHHFLLGSYAVAYPAWFSEGYAEFVSTATVKDGRMLLGNPANHRAYSILYGDSLSISQLFAPPARMSAEQTDMLYGRGWLLTHHAEVDRERGKQFTAYLTLLNKGTPSLEAAKTAFGDLDKLQRDLDSYAKHQLRAFAVPVDKLAAGAVTVQPVAPGAAAMLDMRMTSTAGVDTRSAAALYAKAAPVAAAHPQDPVAQGWFAEIAYDAGKDDAAEAAADRAIAVDPTSVQALLYKARVHLRRVGAAKSREADRWAEARSWIIKANRANANDAAPLLAFYESFLQQQADPSKSAIAGLYRAQELVPQDPSLRFLAARQLLIDGDAEEAGALLRPLAYDPHAGSDNLAAKLVGLLATPEGRKEAVKLLTARDDGDKPAAGGTSAPPAP